MSVCDIGHGLAHGLRRILPLADHPVFPRRDHDAVVFVMFKRHRISAYGEEGRHQFWAAKQRRSFCSDYMSIAGGFAVVDHGMAVFPFDRLKLLWTGGIPIVGALRRLLRDPHFASPSQSRSVTSQNSERSAPAFTRQRANAWLSADCCDPPMPQPAPGVPLWGSTADATHLLRNVTATSQPDLASAFELFVLRHCSTALLRAAFTVG